MAGNTFERIEKKYLLSGEQYKKLKSVMEIYMQMDQYGRHTICNLYFDTEHFDIISQSLDKPVYKEKLRLRSYGVPGRKDTVFLELKKKYAGIVYKRRIQMTSDEAMRYLDHKIMPETGGQILKEIDYFIRTYDARKKVYIAYDRVAYAGKEDPDFRVTFDQNIRSRFDRLNLELGDAGTLLLPPEEYLMEIKAAGAYPLWLVKELSALRIYPVSFSKYGRIYESRVESKDRVNQKIS